jgi:hypothetical protein
LHLTNTNEMNFTQHLHNSGKNTKEEIKSIAKMRPITLAKAKYTKLIKKANEAKEMYLNLKGRLETCPSDKLEALTCCINYEKETAIDCWNEAQKLKHKINELTKLI